MERGHDLSNIDALLKMLDSGTKEKRLRALGDIKKLFDNGSLKAKAPEGLTNNHVHTTYSFSPYTPAKAVYKAYESGLATVGLMDHDSISGAEEFIESGEILGIATTIGFEMRTDWSGTDLAGKRINNPDQISSAYIAAHGLPHNRIGDADGYLKAIRSARNKRNRAMTTRLNDLIKEHGIGLDFERDVVPLSMFDMGGSITERHILFAFAKKVIKKYDTGMPLTDFLENKLRIELTGKQRELLKQQSGKLYEYDLLNILKAGFVARMYIDADTEEIPPAADAVKFIKNLGAIPTYCYLGDVGASPTEDKKAQRFEDDYLEQVFEVCRDLGFNAIAFMPSRNTEEQLERVMNLCREYGFIQISGEDINQPRQSFICSQLKEDKYQHLTDSAWALVGHEIAASRNPKDGMFAGARGGAIPEELVKKYKDIAQDFIRNKEEI